VILTRLSATHFQRYRELALDNLPSRGIIGVVGENESGKSTIGEAVSFALFGRTLRIPHERVRDVIHWQADSATVRLAFTVGNGREYEVAREVDRQESYFAELVDRATGKVVARGVGRVQKRIEQLVPFTFEEFRHSFHLGQKEFDVLAGGKGRHRQRIVDEMMGIADLAATATVVAGELERLRADRDQFSRELAFTERVLGEYRGLPAGTEAVEARLAQTEVRIRALEESLAGAQQDRSASEARRQQYQGVIAALDAVRLRATAGLFGRAHESIRLATAAAAEQVHALEAAVAGQRGKLEAFREFSAKLDEMEALTRLRAAELNRELKNNLEGVYSEADRDLITPDGKREQLVITEKRIAETEARVARDRSRASLFLWLGVALVAIARAAFFAIPSPAAPLHYTAVGTPLAIAAIVFLFGHQASASHRDLAAKRSRLEMNRSILQDEVSRLRRSLESCVSFRAEEPAGWGERVKMIGSPQIQDLYDRIAARHRDCMVPVALAPGYAEALAEAIQVRCQELAALSRQVQEMEEFSGWLATATHALAASPCWPRPPRPGAMATSARPWTFETFRSQKVALVAAAGETSRLLASLEAAGSASGAAQGDDAVSELRAGMQPLVPTGESAPDPGWFTEMSRLAAGEWPGSAEALAIRLRNLGHELAAYLPTLAEMDTRARSVATRREELQRELDSARLLREAVNSELSKLGPGIRRGRELTDTQDSLRARLKQAERAVRVREALLEMLTELKDQLRARCGPSIAEFMGWVLPRLTGGRYDTVRLSSELAVEIFSSEKGDYVALDRLSGGTIDQLLLALRLAFSKALVFTKESPDYAQYLFFDEPFASFDEGRADSFLRFLRQPDRNFSQIFLVSHLPGLAQHCDKLIETSIAATELVAN
jgi:uncharacterized protein YhaN